MKTKDKLIILEKTEDMLKGDVFMVCEVEDGYVLFDLDKMCICDKIYPDIKSVKKAFPTDKYFIKDKDFAWESRIRWIMYRSI